MAVYSQDVVDAACYHALSLSEEGKFRLRVLAELDAFEHCSNDVRFAQELLRAEWSRSDSDSELLPAVTVETLAMFCTSPTSPLGWRCIQIIHVLNDFCVQWVPLCSDPGVGDVEVLAEKAARPIG